MSLKDLVKEELATPTAFEDWLRAHKTSIVGETGSYSKCPVQQFLSYANPGASFSVGNNEATGYSGDEPFFVLKHPVWVNRFVRAVDEKYRERWVRGEQALCVLREVMGTTAPSEEEPTTSDTP